MEPPREDPLMLLHGSWVEVAPFGASRLPALDPAATPGEGGGGGGEEEEEGGPEEEEEEEEDPSLLLEAILREAQMEASASAAEQHRGDGGPPGQKGPSEEDRSPPGKREDPERPPHCGTLDWPWPSPPDPRLPPKDLAPPARAPRLSPALHRKRGLRDPQLMLLVVPSLLLSHVLALGLGICLGKRLAASSSSAL